MSGTETEIRPYYFLLGKKFAIHTKRFFGPVVASPDALFAVVKDEPVPLHEPILAIAGGTLGGFLGAGIGGGIAGDISNLLYHTADTFECDLSHLPETITSHSDWPLRRRKKGRTFIVPRGLVHHAGSSLWGSLYFDTAAFRLRVALSMFRARRVRRFLAQAGWPPV